MRIVIESIQGVTEAVVTDFFFLHKQIKIKGLGNEFTLTCADLVPLEVAWGDIGSKPPEWLVSAEFYRDADGEDVDFLIGPAGYEVEDLSKLPALSSSPASFWASRAP